MKVPLEYLLQNDTDNFLTSLKTVEIWGGAGAAWEVYGFATKQQEIEFEECFIHLAKLLKESGILFERADTIANAFKLNLMRIR